MNAARVLRETEIRVPDDYKPEPQIKCELEQWQREARLKKETEAAREETRREQERNRKLKIAAVLAAVIAVALLAAVIVQSRQDTAAVAAATVIEQYESRFEATDDIIQRVTIAVEVNAIFGDVESGDLPDDCAAFVQQCKAIAERLGDTEAEATGGVQELAGGAEE